MSKQSKTESGQAKRNKKADARESIVMSMLGKSSTMPRYPYEYIAIEEANGTRRMLQVSKQGVCSDLSTEGLENHVTNYYYHHCNGMVNADLDPTDFAKIRKTYHSLAPTVKEENIAPVRQLSDNGLCWHRLDADLQPGETPFLDEIMGRMTNKKAVMAWIGSLLIAEADTQQYLWIYGAGANGKGSLFRMLASLLGPGYGSEQVPEQSARRFWTQGLCGKRLIVFPDCNNYRFPTTGLFKSITGGDPVRVEIKNGSIFSVTLRAKVAFLSNEDPAISGSMADRRRAIYSEIGPIEGEIISARKYDQYLNEEKYAFMHKCMDLYMKMCPDHGPIPCEDNESLEEIIETTEERHMNLLDKFFELDPTADMSPTLLSDTMARHDQYKRGIDQANFIRWLKRRHNIRKVRKRGGPRVYQGIRAKMETEM